MRRPACAGRSLQRATILISLLVGQNQDEVHQCPNSEATKGKKLGNTGADLAKVEAVNAEDAHQQCQEPRHKEGLGRRGRRLELLRVSLRRLERLAVRLLETLLRLLTERRRRLVPPLRCRRLVAWGAGGW